MRLIHSNPIYRDIAIWYDEFLIPGENFNDSISSALEKSELVALVVTPNLVNESNYILNTEYPMAQKIGKKILPVRMVSTNSWKFKRMYKGCQRPIAPNKKKKLNKSLTTMLKNAAINKNINKSQHDFLIGLAYLNGIDVEVNNETALELIKSSAQQGHIPAIEKLIDMYNKGNGVKRDYQKANEWQSTLVKQLKKDYDTNPNELSAIELLASLSDLGNSYLVLQKLDSAKEVYDKMRYCSGTFCMKHENKYFFVLLQSYADIELGDVFADNHVVKTIYLPNGITRTSFDCFRNCKKLKDIYFPSTMLFSYTRSGNVYPLEQVFLNFPYHWLRKVNIHCAPGSPIYKGFQNSKKQGVRIVRSKHLIASETCGRNIEPYAYCSFTTEESGKIAGIIRELEKSFSCKLKGSYTWSFIEPHEDRHDIYCLDDLFMYDYIQKTEDERQRDSTNASCFIAFVNKAYICSDKIDELFMAVKTNKKIAVYLLENCDLPKELNSLNDMHQLRFDNGTEDERIVKLSNWLSQNDCRVKSQIPDFDIIVKDTGIEILKYTGSKNHVVIEDSYGGIKVTKICNGAFAYCDSILTLFIPKSVLEIEEKAFEHCENYLTVYCHENSIAHNFCVREKIPFQLL